MVKGVTKSGFEFEVDEEIIDDMDFFDCLADMEEGSASATKRVTLILLGEKQRKALREHLIALHERAKTSDLMAEVNEIIQMIPTLKNS